MPNDTLRKMEIGQRQEERVKNNSCLSTHSLEREGS
jgi:hypothetical protein